MAKSKENIRNPFLDFDVTKAIGDFRIPDVNIDSLLEIQRRNIEAMTEANRITVEGVQAIAQRQAEIVRQAFEGSSKAFSALSAHLTPEQRTARQIEFAKESVETVLANTRELSEIAAKSGTDAFQAINARVAAGLDEMKAAVVAK